MNKTKSKIGRIGYTPTKMESDLIIDISNVFHLSYCDVLRLVLKGHWTLDEMNTFAHNVRPKDIHCTYSLLAKRSEEEHV